MTDAEEERMRKLVEIEMQAMLLGAKFNLPHEDWVFCYDMHRRAPRACQRIIKEVREQYNVTPERLKQLEQNRRTT